VPGTISLLLQKYPQKYIALSKFPWSQGICYIEGLAFGSVCWLELLFLHVCEQTKTAAGKDIEILRAWAGLKLI
jgi:hypothetical protein